MKGVYKETAALAQRMLGRRGIDASHYLYDDVLSDAGMHVATYGEAPRPLRIMDFFFAAQRRRSSATKSEDKHAKIRTDVEEKFLHAYKVCPEQAYLRGEQKDYLLDKAAQFQSSTNRALFRLELRGVDFPRPPRYRDALARLRRQLVGARQSLPMEAIDEYRESHPQASWLQIWTQVPSDAPTWRKMLKSYQSAKRRKK